MMMTKQTQLTITALADKIDRLERQLSAAEKERDEAYAAGKADAIDQIRHFKRVREERDEALAWGEKLKEALDICLDAMGETRFDEAWYMAKAAGAEALSTPAPAALAHLRQQVRREALEEAERACEEIWRDLSHDQRYRMLAAKIHDAIRRLAEEAKQEGISPLDRPV